MKTQSVVVGVLSERARPRAQQCSTSGGERIGTRCPLGTFLRPRTGALRGSNRVASTEPARPRAQQCSTSGGERIGTRCPLGTFLRPRTGALRQMSRVPAFWVAIAFAGLLAGLQTCDAASTPQHIVVIGCDGFGSLGFTPSNAPVLHKLMREGAYTLRARGVMPTSSSPNWASMIMGAGPEQHGITSNDWQPDKFDISPVTVGPGGIFPTIYGLIREQKPKAYIACVHDWDGYGRLIEPKVPDLLENVKGSALTAERAIEVIRQKKPTFL